MKLNNHSLRQVFLLNISENKPNSRKQCPSPKEMLRLFRAKKSKKTKAWLIDHVSHCCDCANEFEIILNALRFEKDMNQVTKRYLESKKIKVLPSRVSLRFTSILAGISIACIFVTLLIISNTFDGTKYRDSYPIGINIILPKEKIITGSSLFFQWEKIQDSEYYIFELYDETLYQIWRSNKIQENKLKIPQEVLSRLKKNKRYYWMISAFFSNGRNIESPLKEFLLIE